MASSGYDEMFCGPAGRHIPELTPPRTNYILFTNTTIYALRVCSAVDYVRSRDLFISATPDRPLLSRASESEKNFKNSLVTDFIKTSDQYSYILLTQYISS